MIANRRSSVERFICSSGSLPFPPRSPARAQRMTDYFGCGSPPIHNIPYDGRFTFARLMYAGSAGNCYYRGEPSWAHGYGYTSNGTAESNLMKIAFDVSLLRPHETTPTSSRSTTRSSSTIPSHSSSKRATSL
jgi:hypothetical protein